MPVGIPGILIWAIIIAGCIAVALIVMKNLDVSPPAWAVQIFWVVVLVAVGIFAIRLVAGM